ncbi:Meiotic recombination protein dmc1 [Serendipita sp. 411]|nr:Meiotic recombination protein dmc1 [Serendipita sp. 411]
MPPRKSTTQQIAESVASESRAQSRAASPVQDDDDEPFFDAIEELQNHGINAQDIAKLKSAALNTVTGVRMTPKRQLLKIKGLSEAKVDKIKESLCLLMQGFKLTINRKPYRRCWYEFLLPV